MTFTKSLLAGVSICALSAAPALARNVPPSIHMLSVGVAKVSPHQRAHIKSNIHDPKVVNYTSTVTFTGTLSEASDYKTKVTLLGETWYSGPTTCEQPTKQKWKDLPKKTAAAKISTSTSTGSIAGVCTGVVFTFQDVDYTLTSKTATSDTVKGDLFAPKFQGYNLSLLATVDITIDP